jgi:hypothetical protein
VPSVGLYNADSVPKELLIQTSHIAVYFHRIMSLTTLARLILTQAEVLESACIESGQPIPSAFDPHKPNPLETTEDYQRSSQTLIAAASQLIAAVSLPGESIIRDTFGFLSTTLLDFAVQYSIADILHEHGSKGLDVQSLAKQADVDSSKLCKFP